MKQPYRANVSRMLLAAFLVQSCDAVAPPAAEQQAQKEQVATQQSPAANPAVILPCSAELACMQGLVDIVLSNSPDNLATQPTLSNTPDKYSSTVSGDQGQSDLTTPIHNLSHTPRNKRPDRVFNLFQMASLHREQGKATGNPRHYTEAAMCYQQVLNIYAVEGASVANADRIQLVYEGLLRLRQALTPGVIDYAQLKAEMDKDKRELQGLYDSVCVGVSVLEIPMDQDNEPEVVRAYEASYIQSSKCLYQDAITRLVDLLARFYRESEQELGIAPCKYTVMGLEPVLLELLTPRADVGPALLIEADIDEEIAQTYFRNLIHLVNFRIVNLGPTMISELKYHTNLARLFNRGTHAHLNGQASGYTLVQPVHRMLRYIQNADNPATHTDAYWAYMLEHTCYVYGDEALYQAYTSQRTSFLEQPLVHKQRASQRMLEGIVTCGYRDPAVVDPKSKLLSGLKEFQASCNYGEVGQLSYVEQEIYSLPDTLLPGLALYYGHMASSWEAISVLQDQGIINAEAAHHLAYAVSFANLTRLKVYFCPEHQPTHAPTGEALNPGHVQAAPQPSADFLQVAYPMTSHGFTYYRIAIPLCHKIGSLLSKQQTLSPDEEMDFFSQDLFYDNSDQVNGDIHKRLSQWELAKHRYEAALESQTLSSLETARTFANLGITCFHLNQLPESYKYYARALSVLQEVYTDSPIEVAKTFMNLGTVCIYLNRLTDARRCYELSLSMSQHIYGGSHLDIVDILMKLGMVCFHAHQFPEAHHYYEHALAMNMAIYKSNHPSRAQILANLGSVCTHMNQLTEARQHYARALSVAEALYAGNHPDMARALVDLGNVTRLLGCHDEAIQYQMRALSMLQALRGSK